MIEESKRRSFVATWFYEQDPDEAGSYRQVRGDSSSEAFRDVYRRCVAVYFLTARMANPASELVLVLNRPWREDASRVAAEVSSILAQLGVIVRVQPYSYAPPTTWAPAWRNQFFVLDALDVLTSMASARDLVLLLDSDVVWSGSDLTRAMWSRLERDESLTLHIDYDVDERVNGLTRQDVTSLARSLGVHVESDVVIPYSGGEIVGLNASVATQLCARARELWPDLVVRVSRSSAPEMEEAHFLSMLYWDMEMPTGMARPYVKRLWTQPLRFRNTVPGDENLVLWHVPAEKRYGLRRLYAALTDLLRQQQTDAPVMPRSDLAHYLGIPRNSPGKFVRDIGFAATSRATTALRHRGT